MKLNSLKEIENYINENPPPKKPVPFSTPNSTSLEVTIISADEQGNPWASTFGIPPIHDAFMHTEIDEDKARDMAVPVWQVEPEVMEYCKNIVGMIESKFLFDQTYPEAKNYLRNQLPVSASVLDTLTVIYAPQRETLSVGWSPEVKNYVMFYNPDFLFFAALMDFVYNKKSYRTFQHAYYYFFVFVLAHEVAHILKVHTVDNDILLKGVEHSIMNRVADAYINTELAKILSSSGLVDHPTYPCVGIVSEEYYYGNTNSDLVGKNTSAVRQVFTSAYKKYIGGPLYIAGLDSDKAFGEGTAVVRVRYPANSVSQIFGGKSINLVLYINYLLTKLIEKPKPLKKEKQEGQKGASGVEDQSGDESEEGQGAKGSPGGEGNSDSESKGGQGKPGAKGSASGEAGEESPGQDSGDSSDGDSQQDPEDSDESDELDDEEAKDSEPKDSEPKDSEPKDSEPKDSEPKDSEPKDSEPKDSEPKDSEPKDDLKIGQIVLNKLNNKKMKVDASYNDGTYELTEVEDES